MSKWVTFYYDMFNGVSDYQEHKDKESATIYYKDNYRRYFQLSRKEGIKLPMSYGYPHRKFYGISLQRFKKEFSK